MIAQQVVKWSSLKNDEAAVLRVHQCRAQSAQMVASIYPIRWFPNRGGAPLHATVQVGPCRGVEMGDHLTIARCLTCEGLSDLKVGFNWPIIVQHSVKQGMIIADVSYKGLQRPPCKGMTSNTGGISNHSVMKAAGRRLITLTRAGTSMVHYPWTNELLLTINDHHMPGPIIIGWQSPLTNRL